MQVAYPFRPATSLSRCLEKISIISLAMVDFVTIPARGDESAFEEVNRYYLGR